MSEKQPASQKRGVHGWRAFLLVFGCGTTAAFLVFALIVGGVSTLASGIFSSSKSADSPPDVTRSRQPRESTAPNVLDLCGLIEAQSLMSASPRNRVDNDDDYLDTASRDKKTDPRTVSDDCEWKVVGATAGNWKFHLSYIAFMETSKNSSLSKLTEKQFEADVTESRKMFSDVSSKGRVARLSENSYYYYGKSKDGGNSYVLIRTHKTGVYRMELKSESGAEETGEVEEADFRAEALKVTPYLDSAFEHQIPD